METRQESQVTKALYVRHQEKKYFTKTKLINWMMNIGTLYFLHVFSTRWYDRYYVEGMTMLEILAKINTPFLFLFLIAMNIFFVTIYKLKIPYFEKQKITNLPWPWEQKAEDWHKQLKNMVITYVTNYVIVVFIGDCFFNKFYKLSIFREC